MKYNWKRDCKHFKGEFACDHIKISKKESCEGCEKYSPYTKKILIIKLGSMGDVLRTTPLLIALKEKFTNPKIYWLIDKQNKELIENNPYIDKILVYNYNSLLRLKHEKFDILYSLESAAPGNIIANEIKAKKKYGFYFDESGNPKGYSKAADYYLETALSDVLNKENKKNYQQLIFDVAELDYKKQEYVLNLTEEEKWYALDFSSMNNLAKEEKIIGINIGAADRWKAKSWDKSELMELIRMISLKTKYKVLLLGGPNEAELQKDIIDTLRKENIHVLKNDCNNTLREFMTIINICDLIITGDSLAMHIAIALKKKVIALFFCTPSWMIEDYNRIKKMISPMLNEFLFTDDIYNKELIRSIKAQEVFENITTFLNS